jgi:hypothetical protein
MHHISVGSYIRWIPPTSIDLVGNPTQKHSFTLTLKNTQTVELAAESADDKAKWVAALEVGRKKVVESRL